MSKELPKGKNHGTEVKDSKTNEPDSQQNLKLALFKSVAAENFDVNDFGSKVKALVGRNIDIASEAIIDNGHDCLTALGLVVLYGRIEALKILKDLGVDLANDFADAHTQKLNRTALGLASACKKKDGYAFKNMVLALVQNGVDLKTAALDNDARIQTRFLLYAAVMENDLKTLKLLQSQGIDLSEDKALIFNSDDGEYRTASGVAMFCRKGHEMEKLMTLKKLGVDLNTANALVSPGQFKYTVIGLDIEDKDGLVILEKGKSKDLGIDLINGKAKAFANGLHYTSIGLVSVLADALNSEKYIEKFNGLLDLLASLGVDLEYGPASVLGDGEFLTAISVTALEETTEIARHLIINHGLTPKSPAYTNGDTSYPLLESPLRTETDGEKETPVEDLFIKLGARCDTLYDVSTQHNYFLNCDNDVSAESAKISANIKGFLEELDNLNKEDAAAIEVCLNQELFSTNNGVITDSKGRSDFIPAKIVSQITQEIVDRACKGEDPLYSLYTTKAILELNSTIKKLAKSQKMEVVNDTDYKASLDSGDISKALKLFKNLFKAIHDLLLRKDLFTVAVQAEGMMDSDLSESTQHELGTESRKRKRTGESTQGTDTQDSSKRIKSEDSETGRSGPSSSSSSSSSSSTSGTRPDRTPQSPDAMLLNSFGDDKNGPDGSRK